jgi:hypothetical protein
VTSSTSPLEPFATSAVPRLHASFLPPEAWGRSEAAGHKADSAQGLHYTALNFAFTASAAPCRKSEHFNT